MKSAKEVAARYGCAPASVYRLAQNGELPLPVRIGRSLKWPLSVLEAWEDARGFRIERDEVHRD